MADLSLKEVLEGIRTEIGAGMVLSPKTEADQAWNGACERAKSITQNYIEGYGLFQMTARRKARSEASTASATASEFLDSPDRGTGSSV